MHCPINIDVGESLSSCPMGERWLIDAIESEIPFGEATNTKLNKKTYYTILLEFSGLNREVHDTLNRGGQSRLM